jgi:hypothetical protein
VFPGQATVNVGVTTATAGAVGSLTLTVAGLPAGATEQIQSPGTSGSGSVTLGAGTAGAGAYAVTVTASDGTYSGSAALTFTIGVVAQVSATTGGQFNVAMSTSFQPAEWDYQLFSNFPAATTPLNNLGPQHIRLQGVSQGIPQTSADTWDFTILDAITQPVLGVADHSPEFQIAFAPGFMYDANRNLLDPTYEQFATYTQQLVQYYNTGGFTAGGQTLVSPSPYPITWWGIYNEPNINNLTAAQYTDLYNAVAPAMQTIDPSLKFAAVELADFGSEEQKFMPTFVAGVTAHVDVVATHFYSSCNQADSDQQLLSTVPGFASGVQYIYSQLATNPALATVPVWITENNVNADYDKGGGISACNGTPFVTDKRGSSAFFAAWRPYVFSQLGKAGAQALYHWAFPGDAQYGELDDSSGQTRLSYWVDYWLERMFPAAPGADMLVQTSTDDANLETLAVKNADGSVVVMVANHAVAVSTDNNGPGAPRTVQLDVSALGTFQTASLLTIDANTSVTNGPTASSITPAAQVTLNFGGYGVQFLSLK